jgi:hypothetical protein
LYPLALLVIGLLTYGYAWGSLGYFWDDWEVVFLLHARNASLFSGYFAFDRPFAWPYQVIYAIAGLKPVAWHAATLLLRWAGVLLLYLSLRAVWPRHDQYLKWLGALLLVYPGYLQQSISAAYNRHFTAFFIFALSIYLMVLAVKDPRRGWYLWPLSWVTAFIQIFTIEYFVGLELIRPALLWLLTTPASQAGRLPRIRRIALYSFPYILLLGFYFWWRLIIFPGTIPVTNYAGDFKLLQDFNISFLAGTLALLTRAMLDLVYSTLQVWLAELSGPGAFTLQAKVSWFAFGAAALLAGVFGFFHSVRQGDESDDRTPILSLLMFGLWAFVVSGLPIWLTSKQLSGGGRWDDRFSLAPMLGACMLTIGLVVAFVRPRARTGLLGLLLACSVATQILTVNKYRLDWSVQRAYYWQLAWRVPTLMPQTAVLSFEQPAGSIPGYDASFAMNVLFNGEVRDGAAPYWFFTNDRFLNFELVPGKAISYKDRNLRFSGNTSDAIAVVHQGEDRCLQVLDSPYAAEPFYVSNQEQLIAVSNVARIVTAPDSGAPDREVFGPEPPHAWCYYFEKADLARQQQDWDAILRLDKQAKAAGFAPGFGPEYLPFIEAYAQRGDWARSLDLSKAAQKSITEMEPLLCATWARLARIPSADAAVVDAAFQAFACPPS